MLSDSIQSKAWKGSDCQW